MTLHDLRTFKPGGDPAFGPATRRSIIWHWLRTRFIRADRITFCQHCVHDL